MDTLMETIKALIGADWDESRRIIERHPELLHPEVDRHLQYLVTYQEEEGAKRVVERYRSLLARCREVGVEKAFAELDLVPSAGGGIPRELFVRLMDARIAGDIEKMRAVLAEYPEMRSVMERFEQAERDRKAK